MAKFWGGLAKVSRYFLSFFIAITIFVVGGFKYRENSFFMPFWSRDYSNFTHGVFNLGNTGNLEFFWPATIVVITATAFLVFSIYKGLIKYPANLNPIFLTLLLVDTLVIATFINLFLFTGTISEFVLYFGAFALGAFVFGREEVSRYAVLAVFVLVMVRLLLVEDANLTAKFIVPLMLIYFFLRAPFDSASFKLGLEGFTFNKLIGK